MSRSAAAKIQAEPIEAETRDTPLLKIADDPRRHPEPPAWYGRRVSLDGEFLEAGRRFSAELQERFRFLRNIRPAALGTILAKVLGPEDRRRIVRAENGLKIFADPFSHLGGALLEDGRLESDTEAVIRRYVRPGDTFLDIGANEGYFSALAGRLVGPAGLVIAVEPQSRLRDIIYINLRLNDIASYRIYSSAFGGEDGESATINLWPSHNTGASSLVRSYRFSRNTESVRFVSLDRILRESGVRHLDFVKVDVEGFEAEVVHAMAARLRDRRIGTLYLDYHAEILARRGINPRTTHDEILSCGYRMICGDEANLSSYRLYQAVERANEDRND